MRKPEATIQTHHKRGRRAREWRLLSSRRYRAPSLALACLSVLLLLAAGAVYLLIYHQGDTADQNAHSLLEQYNQLLSQPPAAAAAAASPRSAAATENPGAQPEALAAPSVEASVSLSGYAVMGKLRIGKIGLELPVLSETTSQALEISICYYGGSEPGEPGNMLIAGHNYASGAHFGRLDRLQLGDAVAFDTPDGKEYRYTVSGISIVKPDDWEALAEDRGGSALALITCETSGNRRRIVWCDLE